ncbi:MAG TPA: aminoglycoside phosphotransferase family protein [Nocardioides sp.]|uniref:aminoglycoside phosphotransferase family protein n=1 Tax=Nocardioides sp. TaxID=35761 RepID=UPI002F424A4C
MTSTSPLAGDARRTAEELLSGPDRGVLLSMSKDPDAKVTFVTTSPGGVHHGCAVKVATTPRASLAVEAEGRALVGLRRMPLGSLRDTIPRYVDSFREGSTAVLVSSIVPGVPMSVGYHNWLHTARPQAVRTDLRLASRWLRAFQQHTAGPATPLVWAAAVRDDVAGRWDGHPDLAAALGRLDAAVDVLQGSHTPTSAVHGDFWFGNLLVTGDEVSGVIDWESAAMSGCPLRDRARFALSYCLYLDRHTRPGHRVLGHPGLRRASFGSGVRYGLLGTSWLSSTVREFLAGGLEDLGLPRGHWYAVALAGLGEIAASANDETFGADHLGLLARLPPHPRLERRQA